MALTAAFDAGMIDTGELGRRLALKMVEAGEFPVRMVASLYVNQPGQLPTALATLAELNARYHTRFSTYRR